MTKKTFIDAINNLYNSRKSISKTLNESDPAFFLGAENITKTILKTLSENS